MMRELGQGVIRFQRQGVMQMHRSGSTRKEKPETLSDSRGQGEKKGLALLRGRLLSFSATERSVARYIMTHMDQISRLSMAEIAAACQVSDTTVLRTCRHAGFNGFSELKIAIIRDTASSTRVVPDDISRGDSPYTVARKVFAEEIQALYDTLELLSEERLKSAVAFIEKARRVLIVGVGQSSIMSQTFCVLLRRLDFPAIAPSDIHLQFAEASLLTEKDLCIVISYSGRTRDPIEVMKTAKSKGAATICITGNEKSPAAIISDLVLVSISHERTPDPVSSRISQIAIFHSLYANFAMRHFGASVKREQMINQYLTTRTYKSNTTGRK